VTDGLDQALANAWLALLNADPIVPALVVFDGYVPPNTAVPYVNVYVYTTRLRSNENNAINGQSKALISRAICHCVGGNSVQARAIAQRTRTQLIDARPTIAGLSVGMVEQEDDQPPARDESTGVPVFDTVQVYALHATAA
jgi:hypothetical protein